MYSPATEKAGPPSLLGVTIRRALVGGRLYLIIGTALGLIYSAILSSVPGPVFITIYPALLPIFTVTGSLGALVVFTNDRLKGVFEYLIAYGVTPRRLFLNTLLATLVLLSIVVGSSLTVGVGLYLARGRPFTLELGLLLGLYSLPMSFAAAALAATVGMFWTSLSSPRTGMNSPIGLLPLIGITPPLVTLFALAAAPVLGVPAYAVAFAALVLVAVPTIVLLSLTGRLLRRERLLSPA
jgi:hypothetical protein